MALKLKSLLEGYAWERKADGSLPTLKDSIAVHEANKAKKEPRWQDNDGDGKWYEPGDDVKEGLTEYGDDETHSLHVPKTGVESYDAAYDKPEDAMNESFWNRVKGNLHGHEYILREAFRK